MRFYTQAECEAWLTDRKRVKPDASDAKPAIRLEYPSHAYRIYSWTQWIAASITYQNPSLLWITECGIWPSSENLHLYYRLRQSYQDTRLVDEAPGHFFLGHEISDLTSYLQIAMLNGWGGYILTEVNYANVFFSHDEFIDFYSDDATLVKQVQSALTDSKPPNL